MWYLICGTVIHKVRNLKLKLCEISGVTANELLSGKETDMKGYEKKADKNLIVLNRKDKNNRAANVMISIIFSATLLIGITVCLICNIAISGSLTWSLIPVSSIVFAWAIFYPGIILGKRGIIASLISLSVFIIPYLFLLSSLIKAKEIFSVGVVMAAASIIFLWIIAGILNHIGKTRKWTALGMIFLLAVPFIFTINIMLSKMIATPILDRWDMLPVFVLSILAFVSFICGRVKKRD